MQNMQKLLFWDIFQLEGGDSNLSAAPLSLPVVDLGLPYETSASNYSNPTGLNEW